jgi:hypothetical protein
MSGAVLWKAVPGYEGLYEVSDTGLVKSLSDRFGRERILKAAPATGGYLQVTLTRHGVRASCRVHVLIASAFIGPRPDGQEVRHLDGNRRNNDLRNLRYGTQSRNTLDSVAHGTHNQARKTHCVKGHPLVDGNLYTARGYRECMECRREAGRRSKQRRRVR